MARARPINKINEVLCLSHDKLEAAHCGVLISLPNVQGICERCYISPAMYQFILENSTKEFLK